MDVCFADLLWIMSLCVLLNSVFALVFGSGEGGPSPCKFGEGYED